MAANAKGIQIGQPLTDNGSIILTDERADLVKETGARWIRFHFRLGNNATDTPEFYAAYDLMVDRLLIRGMQIIGLVTYETCRGTQRDWIQNSFERTGGDGYNEYIDRYVKTFERIVQHYQNKIRFWELWNEPNCWNQDPNANELPGGSFIFPSNFAALLTECHARVHFFNQLDVQIISGGMFGHSIGGFNRGSAGAEYLDQVYETGLHGSGKFAWARATYGQYPIDIVGQHIYLGPGDVEQWFERYINWYAGVIQAREQSTIKPIFMTEYGWDYDRELTGNAQADQERVNAAALRLAMGIMDQHGAVQAACYFNLSDTPGEPFGLCRADLSRRRAFQTFVES